jgi:S-adenosyl-L-methionine hydrolase (adenosine-forming)
LALITISTDFGWQDPYVGIMKGVILGINPQARLVDLIHSLSHHRLVEAAFVLQSAYAHFPEGTIHLAVVDPGVGGERRLIGIQGKTQLWIGPDNGLFTLVLKDNPEAVVIHLTHSRFFLPDPSHTFHGRDIMAPVAAHLSLRIPLTEMGPPVSDPILLPLPDLKTEGKTLTGRVIWADHFGNLITNIHQKDLSDLFPEGISRIAVGGKILLGLQNNYAQGPSGGLMALIGSSGYLEIACNLGSAAEKVGYEPGRDWPVQVMGG